jgi:hypothetical protein
MDRRYFALINGTTLSLHDKTTRTALYSCQLDASLGEVREIQAHNGYIMTSQIELEKSIAVIYNFFPNEKQRQRFLLAGLLDASVHGDEFRDLQVESIALIPDLKQPLGKLRNGFQRVQFCSQLLKTQELLKSTNPIEQSIELRCLRFPQLSLYHYTTSSTEEMHRLKQQTYSRLWRDVFYYSSFDLSGAAQTTEGIDQIMCGVYGPITKELTLLLARSKFSIKQ